MKNHIPLHEQARLNLSPERLDKELELFPAKEVVWERILCLASLARAINPDFGDNLRFVKKAPLDIEGRNQVDFDIVLTHSKDQQISMSQAAARRSSGTVRDADVSLEEALRQVLPAEVVEHELGLINRAPAYGFASGAAAAIQEAFVKGWISLNSAELPFNEKEAEREVWVTSGPVPVSDTQFMRHPTVARWVWMAPNARELAENNSIPSAVNSIRQDVLRVRELLNKSFAKTTAEERQEVADRIFNLNRQRHARPSFEEVYDHSWVGYALARRNGEGWTQYLVDNKLSDINNPYAEQKPLLIALAQDDASSARVLLERGLSPNLLLSQYPELYDAKTQGQFRGRDETGISLVLFTTLIEAKQSTKMLLEVGADPNILTSQGSFPLLEAANKGDSSMVRLLLEQGANPGLKNYEGDTADLFVPEAEESLYQLLKNAREVAEDAAEHGVDLSALRDMKGNIMSRRQAQEELKKIEEDRLKPFPMDGMVVREIKLPGPIAK